MVHNFNMKIVFYLRPGIFSSSSQVQVYYPLPLPKISTFLPPNNKKHTEVDPTIKHEIIISSQNYSSKNHHHIKTYHTNPSCLKSITIMKHPSESHAYLQRVSVSNHWIHWTWSETLHPAFWPRHRADL